MNKYYDVENYEINVIPKNNKIFFSIRNKNPIFGSIDTEISSTIFDIKLLHQIICNAFSKKDGYTTTVDCYMDRVSNILINIKLNEKIDITLSLLKYKPTNCESSANYCRNYSDGRITLYDIYDKPIEEFEDKIFLLKYIAEYKFGFEDIFNYYVPKNIDKLEIKSGLNYLNMKINEKYNYCDWEGLIPDKKFRYFTMYNDKYFHINTLSTLRELIYLTFEFYKYSDLESFESDSLKYLQIGSLDNCSKINTLKGISKFKSLTSIKLINCNKLCRIVETLSEEENKIEEIDIEYCSLINVSELITYCLDKNIKLRIISGLN